MAATAPTSEHAHIQHHRSDLGEWESIKGAPAAHLRGYVTGYEGFVEHATAFSRRMEVPSTVVPLIINFGPKYVVSGPGNRTISNTYGSFVAGLVDAHVIVEATGLASGIQVNFTPIGAHLFLGMPMDEFTNRTVRFEDVFGPRERRLIAQLEDTPDWDKRFTLLDDFIADRIALARAPSTEIAWAWRQIEETVGAASIGALAAEIGWSRKHLIARFREHIGLPPKMAARIVRFDRAVRQLDGADPTHWVRVAYACGYYDQAHFNRDFRAFTGGTPSEFLVRRIPNGGGLLGD